MGILRNPKEDPTCIRLNFRNESEVDMIQSKGLELEMGTHNKPIILMGVSDRNFDYLAELNKYQVMSSSALFDDLGLNFVQNSNSRPRESITLTLS